MDACQRHRYCFIPRMGNYNFKWASVRAERFFIIHIGKEAMIPAMMKLVRPTNTHPDLPTLIRQHPISLYGPCFNENLPDFLRANVTLIQTILNCKGHFWHLNTHPSRSVLQGISPLRTYINFDTSRTVLCQYQSVMLTAKNASGGHTFMT